MNLDALFRQALGVGAADLRGTALAGSVPLTNAIIDQLLARWLASKTWPVTSVQIVAQAGDSFSLHVEPRAPLVPKIRANVTIERQPVFPGDPVLHLRWTLGGMGSFTMFATPLLAAFKPPPGVLMEGDRITIDLATVLESRGLGDVVAVLREFEVRTEPGVVVVRFAAGL